MSTRRARRLGTTIFVVLALLVSQLALAGYACPASASRAPEPMMQMEPGEPCAGSAGLRMDDEQAVLCHQHCANAPQSFEPLQPLSLAPAAVVQALIAPLVVVAVADTRPFGAQFDPRPPPDPLFLSTLRLRV